MPPIHAEISRHINNGRALILEDKVDDGITELRKACAIVESVTGLADPEDVPVLEQSLETAIREAHGCIRNDNLTGGRLWILQAVAALEGDGCNMSDHDPPQREGNAVSLGDMKKADLMAMAADMGLETNSKMTKADLVEAIEAAQE